MAKANNVRGLKLRSRQYVWWVFVALLVGVGVGWWFLLGPDHTDVLLPLVAAAWGIAFFLHQQHFEDARFFKELVWGFNERYDRLQPKLMGVWNSKGDLTTEQIQNLYLYFNLCAEEYLFFKMGYIYEPVWEAWVNGMRQYAKDKRIAELWTDDAKTNAYYGFEFPAASV